MTSDKNQFCKDSYNKTHLMGKKLKRQKSIIHIKKTLIPQNMWNFKILKFKELFKIDIEF